MSTKKTVTAGKKTTEQIKAAGVDPSKATVVVIKQKRKKSKRLKRLNRDVKDIQRGLRGLFGLR